MKNTMIILALSLLLFSFSSKSKKESGTSPSYIREYNAGVEAQKEKDYAKAIQHYQIAIEQKADFSDAWNNLGYCYRMTAKSYLAKAGDAYGQAIDYHPQHEEALEYQGEYFVMIGQLKNAYHNYQKLKQMDSKQAGELKEKLDRVLEQAQSILKEYTP